MSNKKYKNKIQTLKKHVKLIYSLLMTTLLVTLLSSMIIIITGRNGYEFRKFSNDNKSLALSSINSGNNS